MNNKKERVQNKMTTNEKLSALRAQMKIHHVDVYFIPSSDEHMSEYLPEHWKTRAWLSGFSGSAGAMVVTLNKSALWTDGRYFLQAEKQIQDSEIQLMKMGQPNVPTIPAFISSEMPQNGVLGVDGHVTSVALVREFQTHLTTKNATIQDVDCLSGLWLNRPSIPCTDVFLHELQYAGTSAKDKIFQLRSALSEKNCSAMLLTQLDSLAWLYNIRANDIAFNPFAICFGFVTQQKAYLFIEKTRVSSAIQNALEQQNIVCMDKEAFVPFLNAYTQNEHVLIDVHATNYFLYNILKQNTAFQMQEHEDPVQLLKSIKSEKEIACSKHCHEKDGVAMVRFQIKLQEAMQKGELVNEKTVSDWLLQLRAEQPLNMGASFNSIIAYGANAAMMHYSPSDTHSAVIHAKDFLLVDCGGQYLDGTTDITRTYAMGALTEEQKTNYTLVLKSHIALARAVFMEGCSGSNIDILARKTMWERGLDYRCGTGHGVGHFGAIHEGPQSMRTSNTVKFAVGMTITDEPGLYLENNMGIRIENELVCIEKFKTEYGTFLGFEAFTYCPIDTTPLLVNMMTEDEIAWLNDYHRTVYQKLAPYLTATEQIWLEEHTKKIG